MFDLQNQDFFLGALRFSPILMINIIFAIGMLKKLKLLNKENLVLNEKFLEAIKNNNNKEINLSKYLWSGRLESIEN